MAAHRMTPARRAALRKAQLASARKRRKGGFRKAAKRSVKQTGQRVQANRSLRKANVAAFKKKRGPAGKAFVSYTKNLSTAPRRFKAGRKRKKARKR